MNFQKDVWAHYSQVHSLAKCAVRTAEKEGIEVYPRELKYDLDRTKVADTVALGTIDIPVNRIVGTAVFDEKDLYSPDFLPIASVNSGFAEEWCQLYMDYLTDKGWGSPIRCFEYLGRFYVQDGKKRVSVLKAHGATTTEAIVTRIVSVQSEDIDVANYYEFLQNYEKTGLYQVAFTQPGGFAKLQAALGHTEDYVWNDTDRFGFLFNLIPVEYAFRNVFHGKLNITEADVLLTLLEDYSYSEIRKMQPWELTKVLQNSRVKLYRVLDPDFVVAPGGAAKKAS